MSIEGQLLIIAACMAVQAFLAGMETGVISIHRLRLRHFVKQGAAGSVLLEAYLADPDRLLGTTLVGTNLCTVVASVMSAGLATHLIGAWGETFSTVLVTVTMLVFCEYLPKAWFHERPMDRCRRFVGFLRTAEVVFQPISSAVIWLAGWLAPGLGKSFSKSVPFVTREDLKLLAREGEKHGVLSARERFMIHRVFELSDKHAGQIMVPRAKMAIADARMSVSAFRAQATRTGFTRMPVYDAEQGKFVGIINVFSALAEKPDDDRRAIMDLVKPPLFIPEKMPVDDIFPLFRRSRQPMGLVTDDKGDVLGLVTTEDILEEIVGQL